MSFTLWTPTCGARRQRHHPGTDVLRLEVIQLAEVHRVVFPVRLVDAVHGIMYGPQVTSHAKARLGHQHAHVQVHLVVPAVRRHPGTTDAHDTAPVSPPATAAAGPATTTAATAATSPAPSSAADRWWPYAFRCGGAARHQREGNGHSKRGGRPPHKCTLTGDDPWRTLYGGFEFILRCAVDASVLCDARAWRATGPRAENESEAISAPLWNGRLDDRRRLQVCSVARRHRWLGCVRPVRSSRGRQHGSAATARTGLGYYRRWENWPLNTPDCGPNRMCVWGCPQYPVTVPYPLHALTTTPRSSHRYIVTAVNYYSAGMSTPPERLSRHRWCSRRRRHRRQPPFDPSSHFTPHP